MSLQIAGKLKNISMAKKVQTQVVKNKINSFPHTLK